mmetsp:Transcript_57890/g.172194  ORF Transcript_57890/g.172194 Transcript_57890/m.172194 type:complete len:220 (+) Transcript_57890:618-1277(+)
MTCFRTALGRLALECGPLFRWCFSGVGTIASVRTGLRRRALEGGLALRNRVPRGLAVCGCVGRGLLRLGLEDRRPVLTLDNHLATADIRLGLPRSAFEDALRVVSRARLGSGVDVSYVLLRLALEGGGHAIHGALSRALGVAHVGGGGRGNALEDRLHHFLLLFLLLHHLLAACGCRGFSWCGTCWGGPCFSLGCVLRLRFRLHLLRIHLHTYPPLGTG